METSKGRTMGKKILSSMLALIMVLSCLSAAFPMMASAAASSSQISALTSAISAYVNSGQTGSYSVSGSAENLTYTVSDNTTLGYIYNIAVALAPVFANEMSTASESGNNWWTIMRNRIKSLTGYTSGAGATIIDVLLPVVSAYDTNNRAEKEKSLSTPDPFLPSYGNIGVKVTRTVSAAILSYSTLESLPSVIDIAYQYYCGTAIGNKTGNSGIKRYRKQWYYFGSGLTYGVAQQDSTSTANIKAAGTYFTISLVGQSTYQLASGDNASSIATLINNNNYYYNVLMGISADLRNRFFTNPSVTDIQNFMNRAVAAQTVIAMNPANTWFQNAIANGYNNQDYNGMKSLYSTAVSYYNSLAAVTGEAKTVLQNNYGMNLTQYNAFKEQLLDDIEVYELTQLKNAIDQKKAELEQYRIPADQLEQYKPHLFFGDASTALTNIQLDVASGQFAGWVSTLGNYQAENINKVFTSGTAYVSSMLSDLRYEINVRNYETVYAQFYEFFIPRFGADLTAIKSEVIYGTLIPEAQSQRTAYNNHYNTAVSLIGQDTVNIIFGNFGVQIDDYIDRMYRELEARITAEVNLAYSYYSTYNKITYQNFTMVKDAIGRVETGIYNFLASTAYMSQDTRNKYSALYNSILNQYNNFVATGGYSIYQQQTLDGGTGIYYVRNPMGGDLTRDPSDPNSAYRVTEQRLLDTLKKTDDLLLSEDFLKLTGSDEKLDDMLKNMLAEELFTDESVNKIMSTLYPTFAELLNEMIADIPSSYRYEKGFIRVTIDINILKTPAIIAQDFGLQVFPNQLASKINASMFPDVYNALNSNSSWTPLLNEDEELELNWGIDELEDYNAKKTRFMNAFAQSLKGIEPLLRVLLCNYTWKAGSSSVAEGEKSGISIKADVDLTAYGNHGYINTIAPILEAIGCNPSLIANASAMQNITTTEGIVNAIFNPILDFIENKLAKAPLDTIVSMLPNLAYAISFDRIKPLLNNLGTSIYYYIESHALSIKLADGTEAFNVGDSLDLDDMDLDLTSLNGLLSGFLFDDDDEEAPAQLPLLNTGLLAFMGQLQVTSSVRQVSMTGLPAGQRYNIVADKADVFYYLLSYLLEAISDPVVREKLLGAFSDDDEEEEVVVQQAAGAQVFSAFAAAGFTAFGADDEEEDEVDILDIILQNLGLDLSAWDQYGDDYDWGFEDGDREGFMNALYTLLAPLTPVLKAFLADQNLNLIVGKNNNPFISLNGYKGYAYGIVPLLEALGVKNLKSQAQYEAAVAADPTAALRLIIDPLFDRLNEIAADPINEILQILPALLHYIDCGGIQTTVNNILYPLYAIIDTLRPVYAIDLDTVLKDGFELDLDEIINGLANNPQAAIAVIVELLNPQDYSMKTPNWKYTDQGNGDNVSIVYLGYGTRWTKAKAQDVLNNIDIIVNDLIKDEDEGIGSLSDYIMNAINGLFTVDTIRSLAETLRGLSESLFGDDEDEEEPTEPEEPTDTTAPTTQPTTAPTEPTAPTETTAPTTSAPTEPTTQASAEPEEPEDEDEFEFSFELLNSISLDWLLAFLESQLDADLEFAEIVGRGLKSIFQNVAVPYTSANGTTAYTTYGALDNADVFTCVLSILLEVVTYGDNAEVLDEMLETDGLLPAVTGLFAGRINDMAEIDWLWFTDDIEGPITGDTEIELPERSIVFLTYPNNWTKATANYLDAHLAEIVDSVIRTSGDYASLAEMLSEKVDFYNDDTVNSLLKALKDITAEIDRVLLETVGVVLELDLTAWDAYEEDHVWGVTDRESFVAAVCEVLMPLAEAVDWLLYGDDYTFFEGFDLTGQGGKNLITIKGADGFAFGIVPLLEAIGCKNILNYVDIKAELESNPESTVRFTAILNPILDRLEEILANPVDELLGIIPNLIFFINANGLSVSIKNTLHAVLNILEQVGPAADISLEELIGFSIDDLTFTGIFEILKAETGIDLNAPLGEFLSTFWLGDLTVYTSANGTGAIRMDYSEDEHRGDLITIVFCLLIHTIQHEANSEKFREMLGDETYDAILNVLNLREFPMQDIRWYNTEYADTDTVFNAIESSQLFEYGYGSMWTKQKATYIANNIGDVVDNIVKLLGPEGDNGQIITSLDELIADLANGNIYTSDTVNSLVETLQDFVAQIDELGEAGEHAKALIYEIFGIDLDHWKQFGPDYDWGFENGDRAAFIAAVAEVLSPLNPILEWLLCDKDISFFVDENGDNAVTFLGAEGYAYGIIPLLEALGCQNILTPAEYYAAVEENENNILIAILTPLFAKIDDILSDPANKILEMLPGIIYFVNSNGLDTAFKNILHPVYGILHAIEPVVQIDLYDMLGIRLDEYNFESLYKLALSSIAESTGFSFDELVGNAINELALGTIVSFQSKNGQTAYTMVYAPQADQGDMVTILLRLGIKFLTYGNNMETVKTMIKERDMFSPASRKYVLALLETMVELMNEPRGVDATMGVLYYVFIGAERASDGATDILDQINKEWKAIIKELLNSDSELIKNIGKAISDLLNENFDDIFDEGGLASNGLLKFFAKIREFFEMISNFFKNLLKF